MATALSDFKYNVYLIVFIDLLFYQSAGLTFRPGHRGVNITGMSLKPWMLLERI